MFCIITHNHLSQYYSMPPLISSSGEESLLMNDWHFLKVCVNYFKILWLLRSIRNCVGNPWTINCRSERNRVSIWESIEGFKTLEQLINDSNQTTLSSKSARLKLVLRLFFLVVIRHFLCGLPLYFLSQIPVQCAICFMRKKKC